MNHIAVVETVTGSTLADLVAARDRSSAELVELRLDGVSGLDVRGALDGRRTPVIVTCRAGWEGGRFDGSEDERLSILETAMRLGAEFIDVEWKADRRRFSARGNTRLVISHHDFVGIPADLKDRVRAMQAENADVIKVAITAHQLRDCLVLRDAMRMDTPHVAIAMGSAGQLTRLCPWLFGSAWTYGGSAAPGQISAEEMVELYRIPRGSAATSIYAITGKPLVHSASPAMHNTAFADLGLDAIYVRLETADADQFLAVADAIGLKGASVTAPLKPSLCQRVSSIDALSAEIGALNTLRRQDGVWEGRNFDADGFLGPLRRRGKSLRGIRAAILGAGGTARMAAWALSSEGASVEVSARKADRADAIAGEFGVRTGAWPPEPGWDLLVNTTPVGTWPRTDEAPIAREAVRGGQVYDLIYNPRETTLLMWAREHGAETIGGLEMLVSQACHQFEWWTGRPAPAERMEQAADTFVRRSQEHAS